MNARNGKIAHLPRFVRVELNERLECSEESPQLLEWLNALPEVREVVQKNFAGVPISKQNLSEWRQGGFAEWLARRDLCEDARDVTQLADAMDEECSLGVLADDVAMVLAARFGSLIANWNGEVDEKFEAKSRVLNRLCRSVVQLQRGMHRANLEAFELAARLEEKEKAEQVALQDRLVNPLFDMLKVPAMAKAFGGGETGRKIAEFILSVQRGKLDTPLNILPTDKNAHKESAAKPAESVKPAQKRRPVKKARKTKPANADKPLKRSDIQCEKEGESSQDQSDSVKVGQTSFPEANDEAPGLTTAQAKATWNEASAAGEL